MFIEDTSIQANFNNLVCTVDPSTKRDCKPIILFIYYYFLFLVPNETEEIPELYRLSLPKKQKTQGRYKVTFPFLFMFFSFEYELEYDSVLPIHTNEIQISVVIPNEHYGLLSLTYFYLMKFPSIGLNKPTNRMTTSDKNKNNDIRLEIEPTLKFRGRTSHEYKPMKALKRNSQPAKPRPPCYFADRKNNHYLNLLVCCCP
jgi:hypothetical protein